MGVRIKKRGRNEFKGKEEMGRRMVNAAVRPSRQVKGAVIDARLLSEG